MGRSSKAPFFDARYPSGKDLRKKAKQRIPNFAFDYLDGGCNEEINLHKNTSSIGRISKLTEGSA